MADARAVDKRAAALAAARMVETGMTVGLGTGSTAAFLIEELGRRCREGSLSMIGVCTSRASEELAVRCGVPTADLDEVPEVELYIDGADQIDPAGRMIKGGGGAHLREKFVALAASQRVIVADDSKLVRQLGGAGCPVPVEIARFGHRHTLDRLREIPGCDPQLRLQDGRLVFSDEEHFIADCFFPAGIDNPRTLAELLKATHGVLETGLFLGLCDTLIIGKDGRTETRRFARLGYEV